MTSYSHSAYGSTNPNAGYPANGDFDAWGGYCWPGGIPSSLLGTTTYVSGTTGGQTIATTIREELVELWNLALQICDTKWGYPTWSYSGSEDWGPWGYENRCIDGTDNPSGHSAGLSVDINAPYNPYSYSFECDMPPGMVSDLESLGLYWGGRYVDQKYDPMHFGFCRAPSTVAGYIDKARALLGGGGDDDMPLNDADKAWINDAIADGLTKALRQDEVIITNDRASTPNDVPYTFETALERIIRITTGTYVGETGKPHND